MTTANLYQLTQSSTEKFIPSLLQKILESKQKAVIYGDNESQVEELSKYLWTFSQSIFLPHGSKNDTYPERQPIYLTWAEENPNQADNLIVISTNTPLHAKNFTKCADICDSRFDNGGNLCANKLKAYEAQGVETKVWKQDDRGKWVGEKNKTSLLPSV